MRRAGRVTIAASIFIAITAAVVLDAVRADPVTRLGPVTRAMPDIGEHGMLRGGSLYVLWTVSALALAVVVWSVPLAGARQRSLRVVGRLMLTLVIFCLVTVLWYAVILSVAEG